jgi:hypothetical protein
LAWVHANAMHHEMLIEIHARIKIYFLIHVFNRFLADQFQQGTTLVEIVDNRSGRKAKHTQIGIDVG